MTQPHVALAEMLAAEGVEVVFGLLGGGIDALVYTLSENHGVRFVPTRHEQAACGMADGYSRATGRIGVAIVTYGPGFANTGATMTAARLAGSPVLLVTSDTTSRFDPMNFDQRPFALATAGAVRDVVSAETMSEDVQLAFRHLRLGRGPIVLSFPYTVARQEMPEGWSYDAGSLSQVVREPVEPSTRRVAEVAELIQRSERPLVLVGRGALLAGARDAVAELAARSGALLTQSILARGAFRGDPFDVGLSGGFAPDDAREILAEADLVLAFGAGLNLFTMGHGALYAGATVVQVDHDPAKLGHWVQVDETVVGDARLTAEALLAELGDEPRTGWRTPETAARIAAVDRWAGIDLSERPGLANPYALVREFDRLRPPDNRLLVVDVGLFMGAPAAHVAADEYVFPWHLGYVGGGLPAAVGAAIGRPERDTVLFAGDGGIMAALADLDTAVRANVPLLIVVMDDGGFGAERRLFRARGEDPAFSDYANPDIAAAARALGLDAHTLTSTSELEGVLAAARPSERPTLIHAKLDPDVPAYEMARAYPR